MNYMIYSRFAGNRALILQGLTLRAGRNVQERRDYTQVARELI